MSPQEGPGLPIFIYHVVHTYKNAHCVRYIQGRSEGYRCIADAKSPADFLKGTVLHVVQPHDLRIIGRILAQRLYENIGNKHSAQIIVRAECYFIFQTSS